VWPPFCLVVDWVVEVILVVLSAAGVDSTTSAASSNVCLFGLLVWRWSSGTTSKAPKRRLRPGTPTATPTGVLDGDLGR
jgi:hypothetical protein